MTTATTDLHRHVVQAAMMAPSVHNTQPWRFSPWADGLDLWADPDRQLRVLDPDGRQLHLSCGAALLNARVGARALGLDAQVQLLPELADPTHLARLSLLPGPAATAAEQALAEAIPRRHTYREAFDVRPLAAELLEGFRITAEHEGAWLQDVADDDLVELEVLLSREDRSEQADPAYREELATWVTAAPGVDGIPAAALPLDPERGSSLRLRDFGATGTETGTGTGPAATSPSPEPPAPEHPDVVLLLSRDDTPLSWLQAGQALGAVLLQAAEQGVLAQPLGQVTDAAAARDRLGRSLGVLGTPQLALRLGYASAGPGTGRRSVADVLAGQAGAIVRG